MIELLIHALLSSYRIAITQSVIESIFVLGLGEQKFYFIFVTKAYVSLPLLCSDMGIPTPDGGFNIYGLEKGFSVLLCLLVVISQQ